jgi:predicted RNA-binding protein with TRAM domain
MGYGGFREGGFNRQFSAPVKEGQEIEVKIEAVGEKGDGIAKVDGFVLFVPNTKVGDEVKIKITRVLRKVGFAEVVGKASAPVAAKEEKAEKAEKPAKEKAEKPAKEKAGKGKAKKKEEEVPEVVEETEEEEEEGENF